MVKVVRRQRHRSPGHAPEDLAVPRKGFRASCRGGRVSFRTADELFGRGHAPDGTGKSGSSFGIAPNVISRASGLAVANGSMPSNLHLDFVSAAARLNRHGQ